MTKSGNRYGKNEGSPRYLVKSIKASRLRLVFLLRRSLGFSLRRAWGVFRRADLAGESSLIGVLVRRPPG